MKKLNSNIQINIEELLLEQGWPALHTDQLQQTINEKLSDMIEENGMPIHLAMTDSEQSKTNFELTLKELDVTVAPSMNTNKLAHAIAQALYQSPNKKMRAI